MIELRMVQDRKNGAARASLGVARPKDHAPHARLDNRPGAHCARLDCNIEGAVRKAVVRKLPPRPAQREDFRVRGRIIQMNRPIVGARDHAPVLYNDGAHRHFSLLKSAPSFA